MRYSNKQEWYVGISVLRNVIGSRRLTNLNLTKIDWLNDWLIRVLHDNTSWIIWFIVFSMIKLQWTVNCKEWEGKGLFNRDLEGLGKTIWIWETLSFNDRWSIYFTSVDEYQYLCHVFSPFQVKTRVLGYQVVLYAVIAHCTTCTEPREILLPHLVLLCSSGNNNNNNNRKMLM